MSRTFRIYRNNCWEDCKFKDLKEGDIFKIYDNGEPVFGLQGKITFIATSDAYIGYDDEYTIGVDETVELNI